MNCKRCGAAVLEVCGSVRLEILRKRQKYRILTLPGQYAIRTPSNTG
jgi:hypothetical protein